MFTARHDASFALWSAEARLEGVADGCVNRFGTVPMATGYKNWVVPGILRTHLVP